MFFVIVSGCLAPLPIPITVVSQSSLPGEMIYKKTNGNVFYDCYEKIENGTKMIKACSIRRV